LGIIDKTEAKSRVFGFLKYFVDIDKYIEPFWEENAHKVKSWYLGKDHARDIIISASPEFLLKPVCKQIGIACLIATRMDKTTGTIIGENCYGEEKKRKLFTVFNDIIVEEAYSDSLSDKPLLLLAQTAYLVRKDEIKPLTEKNMRSNFFAQAYFNFCNFFAQSLKIRFLLTGLCNTLMRALLSVSAQYFLGRYLSPQAIFFFSNIICSVPAFLLMKIWVFKTKGRYIGEYIKYITSGILNILLGSIFVGIFHDCLKINAYISHISGIIVNAFVAYLLHAKVTFRR
jgi:putative flippase GtrA